MKKKPVYRIWRLAKQQQQEAKEWDGWHCRRQRTLDAVGRDIYYWKQLDDDLTSLDLIWPHMTSRDLIWLHLKFLPCPGLCMLVCGNILKLKVARRQTSKSGDLSQDPAVWQVS